MCHGSHGSREIRVYSKYISIFIMVKLLILCYVLEVLIKYYKYSIKLRLYVLIFDLIRDTLHVNSVNSRVLRALVK
jgi:hypothetical protein